MADGPEGRFDHVRTANVLPVRRRKVEESQKLILDPLKRVDRSGIAAPIEFLEHRKRRPCIGFARGHVDRMQLFFGCTMQLLRQFIQHVCRLVNPADLLARRWPHFRSCLPEAQRSISDGQQWRVCHASLLQIEQQLAPTQCRLTFAVADCKQFLRSVLARTDHDQHAWPIVAKANIGVNPVAPDVAILFGGDVALAPLAILLLPLFNKACDRRGRQSGGIFAQQLRQRFGEITRRYSLEIQKGNQRFDRRTPPRVLRQNRTAEVVNLKWTPKSRPRMGQQL